MTKASGQNKSGPMSRSENMARIHAKDTQPELAVRKLVHRLGFRFRLYRNDLPGKPDLTLARYKAVIFVHGCFWHQHSDPKCKAGRKPKSNLDYWDQKLERNKLRDIRNQELLKQQGWKILVIWECELGNIEALSQKITDFLLGESISL